MLGFHLVSWLVMAVFGGYLSERSTWALQRRGIASAVVKTTWLNLGVAFFTYILQGVAWLVVQLCAVSDPQAELQLLLPLYLLTPFLVNLMWIDAAHHLLPNRLVYPALALALGCFSVLGLLQGNYRALLGVWVAPLLYGVFMLILTRFGLGMGDAKLMAVLGAWLGFYNLALPGLALLVASMGMGFFALALMLCGRASLRSHLAFGPWLIMGLYVVWMLNLAWS